MYQTCGLSDVRFVLAIHCQLKTNLAKRCCASSMVQVTERKEQTSTLATNHIEPSASATSVVVDLTSPRAPKKLSLREEQKAHQSKDRQIQEKFRSETQERKHGDDSVCSDAGGPIEPELSRGSLWQRAMHNLGSVFHLDSFRPLQREAIEHLFQVPA